jgi:hypothetical protein
MTKLISRLRTAMSALGNEGAVANVVSELARAAAARHAVEQLEARMALATDVLLPDAA